MAHPKLMRALLIALTFNLVMTLAPAFSSSASAMPAPDGGGCTLACSPTTPASGTCATSTNLFIFADHTCTANNATPSDALTKQSAWGTGDNYGSLADIFNKAIRNAAGGIAEWILTKELGSKNSFNSPKLIDKNAADGNSWFLGQVAMVRSIGLYFIIPLLMLVVIQSIVKGSMFFLLRAVLIMLPLAVVGGVAFVAITQLFVNIADDMSLAIANQTMKVTDYGNALKTTIGNLDPSGFGLFIWIWFFVFIAAAMAIFIELILRQIGVYLATLFLPLAFAAMVWPPASRYARRLAELVIGLIFSKVFIIGAFSLGIAAFGHIGTTSTQTANGKAAKAESAVTAVMTGSVVMMMSAFAGTKILQFTPAAVGSAEGYIMNRKAISGRGTAAQGRIGKYKAKREAKVAKVKPAAPFKNPP